MQSDTQRDPFRVWLWVSASYVLAAAVFTWPVPAQLFSHLPLGSLSDPVVPWFNLWTLEWNADRLQHAYAHYWDAPLFYPSADGFALSEPQALTGLLFAPWAWLLGPIAAYNLTLELLLVSNALAARRLARLVGVSRASATWVGVLVLGLPFVRRELGVLQLCALAPVLWGLGELHAILLEGDPRAVLRLGLCVAAALWMCEYYALFFVTLLLPAPLFLVRRGRRILPLMAAGAVGLLLIVVLCWPLLHVQQRAVAGFTRSTNAIHAGSASIWAYLQPPEHSAIGQYTVDFRRPAQRRTLYPGLLVVLLALLGARRARQAPSARFLGYCGVVLVFALFLSFGTRLRIGSFLPYETLVQRVLPGFAQLRSPYRAGVFVQLCLALFAGFGLDALAERARTHTRVPALLAAGSCVLLALVELWPGAAHTQRFPYEALHEPWIAWLASQPAGAVAMVPPVNSPKVAAYDTTVLAMLQALRHGHPIVNGYSGFFPRTAERMAHDLEVFPAPSCLNALHRAFVRYVVVDKRWAKQRAAFIRALPASELSVVYDAPTRSVFRLGARALLGTH